MGLVKFGGGVAGISGKIGGTVYSRNQAGAYARNWAKPVNPSSGAQTNVRTQFSGASAGYALLTTAQVNSWAGYAASLTRVNRQGANYTPSGRQMYMECAQNLAQLALPALANPSAWSNVPTLTAIGAITHTVVASNFTVLSMLSATVVIPSGGVGWVIIEATPPHKASIRNVNNQYRQVFAALVSAAPFNFFAGYSAVFGTAATAGQIVNLRIRVIDNLSGLGSTTLLAKFVA